MTPRPAPADQAQGLRERFAGSLRPMIPVASNPHVPASAAVLERLCAAFADIGVHALLVDASDATEAPQRSSGEPLAAGVEVLGPRLSYLAAHGLPRLHLDGEGSCASLIDALALAAPEAGVVLVHADAADLCRLFTHRAARPLLLAADHAKAVTHAYLGLKLLARRAGLRAHDLVLVAAPDARRLERIALQVSRCADLYAGAVLRGWAGLDPASFAGEAANPELLRLAREAMRAPGQPPCTGAPPRGAPCVPRHTLDTPAARTAFH